MKGGPKLSLRPFLHQALHIYLEHLYGKPISYVFNNTLFSKML